MDGGFLMLSNRSCPAVAFLTSIASATEVAKEDHSALSLGGERIRKSGK